MKDMFSIVFLVILRAATIAMSGTFVAPPQNGEGGYQRRDMSAFFDIMCKSNVTRGVYLPQQTFDGTRCCKEKYLQTPRPWMERSKNYTRFNRLFYISGYFRPYWTSCRENITRDNENDDLPTLLFKIQACSDEHIIGKPGDSIDYKTFVEYRMMNYTNDSTVQTAILDANKECPEGDKETEVHRKLQQYFLCFHNNEEKVCNQPTEEALKYKKSLYYTASGNDTKMNETCPQLPSSVRQILYCCRGKPTPVPWNNVIQWNGLLERYPRTQNQSNDGITNKTKFQECTASVNLHRRQAIKQRHRPAPAESHGVAVSNSTEDMYNKTAAFDKLVKFSCYFACQMNPIVFENGTNGPDKIDWKFEEVVRSQFSKQKLNKRIATDLGDIALKMKSTPQLALTWSDFSNRNQTGKSYDDIEKLYEESTNLEDRMNLYCGYYQKIQTSMRMVLNEYCGLSGHRRIF